MAKLRELPVIMCSMSRWDGALSSAAFSIAKELAKTNRVFYIDYPYTVKDYFSGRNSPEIQKRKDAILKGKNIYTKVDGLPENFTAVTPRMMLSNHFLPAGFLYDILNTINNRIFFKTVRQILQDHSIEEYIFFNSFNPYYGQKITGVKSPKVFVYQARDDIRAFKEGQKHGIKAERKILQNADVRLATSTRLTSLLEKDSGKKAYLLPNAAQTDLFEKTVTEDFEIPIELKGNQKPVVGYVGQLGRRNNFELLEKAIKVHSDKLFLFVGPDDHPNWTDIDLKKYPNVKMAGPKKLAELPRYLQFMDCTIIPFLKNELTASIYPLKLNEQLAAGKAIVSTDFSVDVKRFDDVVFIAENEPEFIQKIGEAVDSDTPENVIRRVAKSEGNSWADRIELFWEILEKETGG